MLSQADALTQDKTDLKFNLSDNGNNFPSEIKNFGIPFCNHFSYNLHKTCMDMLVLLHTTRQLNHCLNKHCFEYFEEKKHIFTLFTHSLKT